MDAFYGEPSCTLCRIRDVLSCGVSTSNNSTCTHLPGFHEKHGFCETLLSTVWNTQSDSTAQMPLVISKGNHHSAHNRSKEHTTCGRKHITNLLIESMVSESKFLEPVVLPPMRGLYNWGQHFELPEQGRGCVSFTADTSNDVHVAISTYPESMDPMYEVVVGGWTNTTSVVRRRSQGPILCTVPVGLKKPVPDAVDNLWVSIDKNTQLIQVGRGSQPSSESLFCIYKDPQFLCKAQYICFTTWDAPATYSNIKVSAIE
ncbi:hypothetical protein KC19_12G159600 [Ceratodon purpureus]|uniref:Farnesoic acid O-methyl transferase domain-containing protein n=1 Tax=Ceratodon purpureus TaxID=3225 RepID=A0A8T0G8C9_CERPU|nr:hypothetical protein KC19_12G159600 [Ceratodon purpureus]